MDGGMPSEAIKILEKNSQLNARFYELILGAELEAMRKRFW
jgi:hypothetical protein